MYVADFDNHRILVFQTDGEFYQIIGSGQLGSLKAVAVNGNNQLRKFGIKGTDRNQLNCPCDVAVDLHGFILVPDTSNHH